MTRGAEEGYRIVRPSRWLLDLDADQVELYILAESTKHHIILGFGSKTFGLKNWLPYRYTIGTSSTGYSSEKAANAQRGEVDECLSRVR